jgi:hypothetical protein
VTDDRRRRNLPAVLGFLQLLPVFDHSLYGGP